VQLSVRIGQPWRLKRTIELAPARDRGVLAPKCASRPFAALRHAPAARPPLQEAAGRNRYAAGMRAIGDAGNASHTPALPACAT